MLRRQISPKTTAVLVLVALGAVYAAYYRGLVYRPPGVMAPMRGGGPPPGPGPSAMGRDDVEVDTLAGGDPGFRDGAGWQARFCGPNALVVAKDGSLFVADSRNHRIRRVDPTGNCSTAAGGGVPGGPGGCAAGAPADARFRFPSGVALGADGTLFVSDSGNHRICRIKEGRVELLAGGTEGRADGTGAAAQFRWPAAMTVAQDGSLWVADLGNGLPRRIDPAGTVTTPAGPLPAPLAAALGMGGPAPTHPVIWSSPDARAAPQASRFQFGRAAPYVSPPNCALYADLEHHVLVGQRPGEPPLLLAGRLPEAIDFHDGTGNRASFALPCAVALSPDGLAYVAEYEGNRIRRVRLPQWYVQGQAPPQVLRQRRWRPELDDYGL